MSVRPHDDDIIYLDESGGDDDIIETSKDEHPESTAKRARIEDMKDEHGELRPEYIEYFKKYFVDNEEIYSPEEMKIGRRPGWAVTSKHWATFLTRSVINPMRRADPTSKISRSAVMHWGFSNYNDLPPVNKVDRYLIIVTMYPEWKESKTEKRKDGQFYLEPDRETYGAHDILIIINTDTKKVHVLDSSGFLNDWNKYMILDLLFPVHQALSNPLDTITRPEDYVVLTGDLYRGSNPNYSAEAHAISIENIGRVFTSRFKDIYKYEMIIEPVTYNLSIRIESATNNPHERGWCAWFAIWFMWWCLVNPDKKPIPPPIPRNAISDFSTFVFSAMGHYDEMPPIPAKIVDYLRAPAAPADEIILPATTMKIRQYLPPNLRKTPVAHIFKHFTGLEQSSSDDDDDGTITAEEGASVEASAPPEDEEEETTVHLLEEPDDEEEETKGSGKVRKTKRRNDRVKDSRKKKL